MRLLTNELIRLMLTKGFCIFPFFFFLTGNKDMLFERNKNTTTTLGYRRHIPKWVKVTKAFPKEQFFQPRLVNESTGLLGDLNSWWNSTQRREVKDLISLKMKRSFQGLQPSWLIQDIALEESLFIINLSWKKSEKNPECCQNSQHFSLIRVSYLHSFREHAQEHPIFVAKNPIHTHVNIRSRFIPDPSCDSPNLSNLDLMYF